MTVSTLERNVLTRMPPSIWSLEELEVLKTYNGRKEILDLLPGKTWTQIRDQAKRQGYTSRKNLVGTRGGNHPGRFQKEFVHDDYCFSALSAEACYWGGFLAADGYINPNKNRLNINLKAEDGYILERLVRFTQYTGRLYTGNGGKTAVFYLNSCANICADLEKHFNIVPKKSLILQPPNLVEEDHIKAFIVGYIDGDGCIRLTSGKNKYISVNIIGTLAMLNWIKSYFDFWYPYKEQKVLQIRNHFSYTVVGNKARYILNLLRKVAPYRLERKWSKIDTL